MRHAFSLRRLLSPALACGLVLAPVAVLAQLPMPAAGDGAPLPMAATPDDRQALLAGGQDGAEGALSVVRRYYAEINRHAYRAAYRQWENNGAASGQTLNAFRQGFARTAQTTVAPGVPTDPEGAAGSVYITVPVTVTAVLTNGTRQTFTGSYVLRRVNDVPGSTAAERRWHLHSGSLKPAS